MYILHTSKYNNLNCWNLSLHFCLAKMFLGLPPANPARPVSHSSRHDQNRWHHHKPGSSVMSSDLESTSFVDSEDDASSRWGFGCGIFFSTCCMFFFCFCDHCYRAIEFFFTTFQPFGNSFHIAEILILSINNHPGCCHVDLLRERVKT